MLHPTLSTLPGEVLEATLQQLDYISLLQCYSVCKLFKTTIDESSELQYIIELAHDGMIDHHSLGLSHAERLNRLRDLRTAWNNLAWKTQSVIPMHGLCHAYELVEGLFVKGNGANNVSMSWLPSSTKEGHEIHREDLKMQARDFAIDPGQNLIVFIDDATSNAAFAPDGRIINLHLRTISTHEAHESASQPVLKFTIPPNNVLGTFVRTVMLELAEDMLAVFVCTWNYRLLIWNWKKDILVIDSYLPGHELPRLTWDFSFITPRAYIMTSREANGSIEIFGIESETSKPPTPIASLQLPELDENVTPRSITTHTGPLNTPSSNQLFVRSPESRMHVICIQYNISFSPQGRYCMFIRNGTFLSYLSLHASGKTPAGTQVPWKAWGPKNTRFSINKTPFAWLRYVHGQRVVYPQETGNSMGTLQIMDFNMWPDVSKSTDSKTVKTICTRPTTLNTAHIFQRRVVTHLPYRTIVREVPDNYSAFMIDEDKIIGLKAQGVDDEELKELHVYTF
ncbi:hypothetical protein BDZ94DRAFT_961713 [Collybia nuda]|uniref:F-box domain-containing protein n=1 Tax=Collybia nuda TaxID=64659 RepID=A0A9P5YE00_9AGAR|nr:hypothetical protein BDZ94DRAFT_961713 [Collybia nuda]